MDILECISIQNEALDLVDKNLLTANEAAEYRNLADKWSNSWWVYFVSRVNAW